MVPELLRLFESPLYVARMVKVPFLVTFTVIEHSPETKVHALDENLTPPVPEIFAQITVPVCDEYSPDIFTVHCIAEPTAGDGGTQLMATCVGALAIVTVATLELPLLFGSPP
jgi:hypothetical protein